MKTCFCSTAKLVGVNSIFANKISFEITRSLVLIRFVVIRISYFCFESIRRSKVERQVTSINSLFGNNNSR